MRVVLYILQSLLVMKVARHYTVLSRLSTFPNLSAGSGHTCSRAIYKVFNLVRHFVLAMQGLLGRCTFIMQISEI